MDRIPLQGRSTLMRHLNEIGLDALAGSERIRKLLKDLRMEWAALDQRFKAYDKTFPTLTRPRNS